MAPERHRGLRHPLPGPRQARRGVFFSSFSPVLFVCLFLFWGGVLFLVSLLLCFALKKKEKTKKKKKHRSALSARGDGPGYRWLSGGYHGY